jgi:hypothetical protein
MTSFPAPMTFPRDSAAVDASSLLVITVLPILPF